jgi:two-component system response regulator ResD
MEAMSQSSDSKGRVLVVDDEPMVREVVAAYLAREGFAVDEAGDGERALELIGQTHPDLVVLDVMLPKLDGFSVLSKVRRVADVPVILLTARTEEPDRVLGLELGADDYVVKPFPHESSPPGSVRCCAVPGAPLPLLGSSSTGSRSTGPPGR